jgi:hypothetical protein
MLESWLNRSGGCLLSIQIPVDYLEPHVEDILEAIIPHRARWEYVKLTVLLSHLIDIQGPMPLLRQLNIRVEFNDVETPAIAFSEAPLLRAVSLNDFTYPPGFMPWSQLTSLTLLATTPIECGPVLEQTINLVHCELIICGWDLIYHDIKLGCLESLTLAEFDHGDPVVDYLDTLILPALRSLQVPDTFLTSGPTPSDPIVTLTSFISKSGCKLQEVLIAGERSIPKDAYRKAFPSIPKFSFDGTFDWNFNQEFKDEDLDDTSLATSDFRQGTAFHAFSSESPCLNFHSIDPS